MNVDKKLVLTAIGIVGFGATIFVAVKNTKKVQTIQDKDQRMKSVVEGTGASQDISKIEWVKKYGKYYIPTLVMYVASSACAIGAYRMSAKEIAALSATCAGIISQRDKIEAEARKQFGDETIDNIKNKVIKEESGVVPKDHIYDTGRGTQLCYEGILGTWFYSSEEDVRKVISTIQDWIRKKNYVGMDDVYEELGIKRYCQLLNGYGWAPTQDGEDPYVPDFHFISEQTEDGTDCFYVGVRDACDMPFLGYWEY